MSRRECTPPFLLLMLLAGCSAPRTQHPVSTSFLAFEPWEYNGSKGVTVKTDHYLIHSTIENPDTLRRLAQVMEGALRQYQQLTPGLRLSARPMECFVFARRGQWAQFTQQHTGEEAKIYLRINRGGYTIRDWYVAYFIGDVGTYAVAAHEGWHQYVARHFRSRLPPFLEEGLATLFEPIYWDGSQPRWNLGANRTRADKLRRAIDTGTLWPLQQLITMHAGDVVDLSSPQIETFYAQNWAFAMFLWDSDNQRYRPALKQMLSDLAAGTTPSHIKIRQSSSELWDPASAGPLLEHYLNMPLDETDQKYQAYIRSLANNMRREP